MTDSLSRRTVRIAPEHSDLLDIFLELLRGGRSEDVRSAFDRVRRDGPPVGPFRSEQAALDLLIARMVTATKPRSIWLFGRRASGRAGQDASFAFLAIFPDDDSVGVDDRQNQLADAVTATYVDVAVFTCSEREFSAFKDTAGSLIRTVHEEGREVYRARPRRVTDKTARRQR